MSYPWESPPQDDRDTEQAPHRVHLQRARLDVHRARLDVHRARLDAFAGAEAPRSRNARTEAIREAVTWLALHAEEHDPVEMASAMAKDLLGDT